MTFRELNMRILEPGSQWVMVAGVCFLCQPWVEVLHSWSVLVMLIGLIGFNITSKIAPEEEAGTGHGADASARNPGAPH